MPKLRNHQSRLTKDQLRERVRLARGYVNLTRALCDMGFPEAKGSTDVEALLVGLCVLIGEAEGLPTTVTKLATHSGLPRQTIYRRLEQLITLGKIVRVGRSYYIAEDAVTPDRNNKLLRILNNLCD